MRFEHEIEAASQELAASEFQLDVARKDLAQQRSEQEECAARIAAHHEACTETQAECEFLMDARQRAENRRENALTKARSMVASDVLDSAAAEASRLRIQLSEQEAEKERLSTALADSWAARFDPKEDSAPNSKLNSDLRALDNMEEELKSIAKMQQQASAEVHHVQKLEHMGSTLQARLRELSEHKASLQSTRVDLGDEGRAMREAIASQNESHIRRVVGLEEEKRTTDEDRKKLIKKCADLQDQLTALELELASVTELEERHGKLEAQERCLAEESRRLSDINGALGALLMGNTSVGSPTHASDGSAVMAEGLMKVFKLRSRYVERMESQIIEKEKLAGKLRALEREAAQTSVAPRERTPSETKARSAPVSTTSVIAEKATSAMRGGLEKLRGLELL